MLANGPWPLAAHERPRVVLLNSGDIQDYVEMITTPRSKSLASVLPILPVRPVSRGKPIFVGLGMSKHVFPTTGWAAVMIAIRFCQEVALYGYSTSEEAGGVTAWGGHGISKEHKIWELLDGHEVEVIAPR